MRVAVTTSADRAEQVAAAFADVGLTPVILPCVRIEPAGPEVLDEVRRAVGGGDVLVLSSTRTLELVWPDGAPPPIPVFAVGAATAAAVRARRGSVAYEGSGGVTELAAHAPLEGRAVVFPRAAGTLPAALAAIARRSASLTDPVVYETVPQAPAHDEVEAAAFGSPSAVHGWVSGRPLHGLVTAAIGTTTAAALREARKAPDVVAPRPAFPALAAALVNALEVVP